MQEDPHGREVVGLAVLGHDRQDALYTCHSYIGHNCIGHNYRCQLYRRRLGRDLGGRVLASDEAIGARPLDTEAVHRRRLDREVDLGHNYLGPYVSTAITI